MRAHDLPDAVGPALLLVEVVGERRRTFAHRQDVGSVDSLPVHPALVALGIHGHAGQVILDDRVLVTADVLEGFGAVQVVGADEQGCLQTVTSPLDDAVEHVRLEGGRAGDPALAEVAVHLRCDDEPHVGVGEVAERTLQEIRARHVVGVHLGDDVVVLLVHGAPRVVVAVLGAGLELAGLGVPLRVSLAGEVVDADGSASRLDVRVVALVEKPDVDQSVVAELLHRLQCLEDEFERLLARDDRRQNGDVKPLLGRERDGIDRLVGEHPERCRLDDADELDHEHHDDHGDRRDRPGMTLGGHDDPRDEHDAGEREADAEQVQLQLVAPVHDASVTDMTSVLQRADDRRHVPVRLSHDSPSVR